MILRLVKTDCKVQTYTAVINDIFSYLGGRQSNVPIENSTATKRTEVSSVEINKLGETKA